MMPGKGAVMALVKRVGKVDETAGEKERLSLEELVPQYEWATTAGESRHGLKLHFISYLPEREREEDGSTQPAQASGFMDQLIDPMTGTTRGGKSCVPLRMTGAGGVALAKRIVGAIALAEGGAEAAKAAMASFDPSEPLLVKGGSLVLDLRENAQAEALRGDDRELVALYAASGALTGRVMYAPPIEFEEGFE